MDNYSTDLSRAVHGGWAAIICQWRLSIMGSQTLNPQFEQLDRTAVYEQHRTIFNFLLSDTFMMLFAWALTLLLLVAAGGALQGLSHHVTDSTASGAYLIQFRFLLPPNSFLAVTRFCSLANSNSGLALSIFPAAYRSANGIKGGLTRIAFAERR